MSDEHLPTALEVAALVRGVQAGGGHAAILHKGDPDRGSLMLFLARRGQICAAFERILGMDGCYSWQEALVENLADSRKVAEFLAKRARFDADLWAVELDIADPQRFIAENLRSG